MKPFLILVAIALLIFFYYSYSSNYIREGGTTMINNETSGNVSISIVYDNYEYDEKLKTGFGFSCLVKLEDKNILFDTGNDSPTLLNNVESLGIDTKEINYIFLSHIHWDHVGGLEGVLEKNSNVTVFIPRSFPNDLRDKIESHGAKFVNIDIPTKIHNGVYSTGELGTLIREQSMIIKTERGLIVITGCAHPGIVNIVKKAKELTNEEVYLVIGGFHLGGTSEGEIRNIVKSFRDLGVKKVAPCHCTGDRAIAMFKEEYKDNFIKAGVGKVIEM